MTFLGPDLQPPQIWTGATTAHHAATCLVTKSKDDSNHTSFNLGMEKRRLSGTTQLKHNKRASRGKANLFVFKK